MKLRHLSFYVTLILLDALKEICSWNGVVISFDLNFI